LGADLCIAHLASFLPLVLALLPVWFIFFSGPSQGGRKVSEFGLDVLIFRQRRLDGIAELNSKTFPQAVHGDAHGTFAQRQSLGQLQVNNRAATGH
jgi:hypothetical protein